MQVLQRVDTADEADRRDVRLGLDRRVRRWVDAVEHRARAVSLGAQADRPPRVEVAHRQESVSLCVGELAERAQGRRDGIPALPFEVGSAESKIALAQVHSVLGEGEGGAVAPLARDGDERCRAVRGRVHHVDLGEVDVSGAEDAVDVCRSVGGSPDGQARLAVKPGCVVFPRSEQGLGRPGGD